MISILIKNFRKSINPNHEDDNKKTALEWLCSMPGIWERKDIISTIIDNFKELDPNHEDCCKMTALEYLCCSDGMNDTERREIISMYIDNFKGLDPNHENDLKMTALELLCSTTAILDNSERFRMISIYMDKFKGSIDLNHKNLDNKTAFELLVESDIKKNDEFDKIKLILINKSKESDSQRFADMIHSILIPGPFAKYRKKESRRYEFR